MVDRRHFIKKAAGTLASLGGLGLLQRSGFAAATGAKESAILDALPGKEALIKKTYRPPNYETPVSYFDVPFTPNNRVSLLGSYREFLWTPLPSPTFSLLTRQWLDFHQLADCHASRTAPAVGLVLRYASTIFGRISCTTY